MRFSIYNIGCKVNFAEISELCEQFIGDGFEWVPFGEPAELVIINTCTVTANADADCRKMIRRAARQTPDAFIAVVGCYAQLKAEEIKNIEGVSAIFGGNEKFRIRELLPSFAKPETPYIFLSERGGEEFHAACSAENDAHTRVVLKIQDGCDYFCSYCAVPFARGSSRSLPYSEIANHYERIAGAGGKEVILSGINLGEYRSPSGEDFARALRLIDSLGLDIRTRISSIEPNLLTDEILEIVRGSESICRHFHIPLQSGSDRILKLMRRRYDTAFFGELIAKIKKSMPDCGIGIDIITGFPGETDEDFDQAMAFCRTLDFTYLHVFSYSERAVAASQKLAGKVPAAKVKERTLALRELSDQKREEFYRSEIGKIHRVIPEARDKKTGLLKAWTDNYVHVAYGAEENNSEFQYVELIENKGEYVLSSLRNKK